MNDLNEKNFPLDWQANEVAKNLLARLTSPTAEKRIGEMILFSPAEVQALARLLELLAAKVLELQSAYEQEYKQGTTARMELGSALIELRAERSAQQAGDEMLLDLMGMSENED